MSCIFNKRHNCNQNDCWETHKHNDNCGCRHNFNNNHFDKNDRCDHYRKNDCNQGNNWGNCGQRERNRCTCGGRGRCNFCNFHNNINIDINNNFHTGYGKFDHDNYKHNDNFARFDKRDHGFDNCLTNEQQHMVNHFYTVDIGKMNCTLTPSGCHMRSSHCNN